jgi:hypothetical protein
MDTTAHSRQIAAHAGERPSWVSLALPLIASAGIICALWWGLAAKPGVKGGAVFRGPDRIA